MRLIQAEGAQVRARDAFTHSAWGQRLTQAQFAAREERLRGHPWAKGGMRTWLLVEGEEVLASCETFRMESALSGTPGVTEGVASVFVEPALRGRGLATRMLQALGERLSAEHAQASILFSDVGPGMYRRAGWVDVPSVDRFYPPAPGDPAAVAELLDEADVPGALATVPRREVGFEVRATASQIDWHIERERCYAAMLGVHRPTFHGAQAGSALLVLCGDLKVGDLVGLILRASDVEGTAAVIQAARRIAANAGLRRLTIWERGERQPWPSGGQRLPRTESLAMIRAFAPGLEPGMWIDTDRALWV